MKKKFVCSSEDRERFNRVSPESFELDSRPGATAVVRVHEDGRRELVCVVVCDVDGERIETRVEGDHHVMLENSSGIAVAKEFVHACAIINMALNRKFKLGSPRKWGGEQSPVPMYQHGEPGKVKGFFIPVECEGQTPKSVRYKIEELTPGEKRYLEVAPSHEFAKVGCISDDGNFEEIADIKWKGSGNPKQDVPIPGWIPSDNVIAKFCYTDGRAMFYLRRSDTHLTIMKQARGMSDYAAGRIDSPGNGYITFPNSEDVLKAALAFVENSRPDKAKDCGVVPPSGLKWVDANDVVGGKTQALVHADHGCAVVASVPESQLKRDAFLACVERFDAKSYAPVVFNAESASFHGMPIFEKGRYAVSFRKIPTG